MGEKEENEREEKGDTKGQLIREIREREKE